ncbi:MAG: MFS transporter [Betaproteobacteria bacterium]|nr:MFS transporter [Betaproteobacteria bacterium]
MGAVWTSVGVTLVIQILVCVVLFAPPVLAPAAHADVGMPASWVGIVMALVYVSSAVAALLSGTFIVRHGPLRIMQFSLLTGAAGIALMTLAMPAAIALGALVIGLGYGMVTPSSSVVLAERAPPHLRAFIFSVKQTGVPIGGAIAGALIPAMILLWGWRGATLACATLCGLCAVGVQPFRRQWDAGRQRGAKLAVQLVAPLQQVWQLQPLRDLALASFAFSGTQMCLGSFLVVFLHERAALTLHAAGAALSTAMLAGAFGRLLWGALADRLQVPRRLLAGLGLAMSVSALITATVNAAWPYALVLTVSFCFGITSVGWNGVYLSEVARLARQVDATAATGGSLFLTYIGVVTMPAVFWALVAVFDSFAAGFGACALVTAWRAWILRGPVN